MSEREEVVVVGMAGRFPGAANVDQLWDNLRNGVESIRPFTVEELSAAGVESSAWTADGYVTAGAPLDDADCFDAAFFGYTKRDAEIMDPQHRIFLETAWAALEDAGYDPMSVPGMVGVFGGVGPNTYRQKVLETRPDILRLAGRYPLLIGGEREYAITRVAFKFGLRGPAIGINTACSTSGVALHLAVQSVLSGECDMAIAGGGRIQVPLTAGYLYEEDGILSPDGHCRTFDAEAKGTVIGNGVALVVIKRMSDALRDGNTIRAVIKGTAVNNDGNDKIGYTAPSVSGQMAVIREALNVAEVDPSSIGYVEAHGTGTFIGDPIEMEALSRIFQGERDEPCLIGSIKTNIGHLDAGAGTAGVIKAVLAMEHGEIPPSLNYERANPQIDFETGPFRVAHRLTPWPANGALRRAGVSTFGLGGTNAHIVLEQAPPLPASREVDRPQLLVLSAKTSDAADRAAAGLAKHLPNKTDLDLGDVSYTLIAGRSHFPQRRAVVVSPGETTPETFPVRGIALDRRAVWMFPGSGAQYVAMGKKLYDREEIIRKWVDRITDLAGKRLQVDLLTEMFEAPILERTSRALPALFAVEYGLAKLLQDFGLQPDVMIGHSLGEYTAACLAGVFSVEDATALVTLRGELFDSLPPGAMLSVPLAADQLESRLGEDLSIAVINRPDLCVVAGEAPAVERLASELAEEGVEARRLPIVMASHSHQVEPILGRLGDFLASIDMSPPTIPFVSNLTGSLVDQEVTTPEYWVKHLRNTVLFYDGLAAALAGGPKLTVEVGPGQTLTSMARQHPARSEDQVVVATLPHREDPTADDVFFLGAIGKLWTAGADVDLGRLHRGETRRRVPLPTYPFERTRYWLEPGRPAGDPILRVPSPVPTLVDNGSEMGPTIDRRSRIRDRLVDLVCDLSGLTTAELDPQATFLELGFDSLFMTQTSAAIGAEYGVRISFRQLIEEAPSIEALAAHLDDVLDPEVAAPPATKPVTLPTPQTTTLEDLAAQLAELQRQVAALAAALPATAIPDQEPEPVSSRSQPRLSYGQERLWRLQRLQPNQGGYVVARSHLLEGSLDVAGLRRAVEALVARHDQLRARFSPDDGRPDFDPPGSIMLETIDLTSAVDPLSLIAEASEEPMDTAAGPLFRGVLWRLGEDRHVLTVMAHHLVCDGWSLALIEREIGEVAGGAGSSAEVATSYLDFVEWERSRHDELEERLPFWRGLLAEAERLRLPGEGAGGGGAVPLEFEAELYQRINELARTERVTPFLILWVLFLLALHDQTGQTDLVICTPVAGREVRDFEPVVGYFNDIVPLRAELAGAQSFRKLLAELRFSLAEAVEARVPFQWVADLQETKLTPLARAMFALNDVPSSGLALPGVSVTTLVVPGMASDFELGCSLRTVDGTYRGLIRYRGLEASAIETLAESLLHLAHKYLDNPEELVEIALAERGTSVLSTNRSAPRSLLESQIKTVWEEVFGRELGVDDDFFELGGHSLLAADLMERLENRVVGEPLPLAVLLAAPTISQLASMIEGRGWSGSWASLVPIRPGGKRTPFFFVHAHGGNVVGFRDLAKRMSHDRPFYAMQAPEMDRPQETRRIEEMASRYLEEVQTVQAHGPYLLGGYCLGGGIAFEMAQQLTQAGEEVAVVVMVDSARRTDHQNDGSRSKGGRLQRRLGKEWANFTEKERKLRYLRKRTTQLADHMALTIETRLTRSDGRLPFGWEHSVEYREQQVAAKHLKAYQRYEARPYQGRVAIVRASLERESTDPTLGWGPVVNGPLDLYEAPGHNTGLLLEPRVRVVAPMLDAALDAALDAVAEVRR